MPQRMAPGVKTTAAGLIPARDQIFLPAPQTDASVLKQPHAEEQIWRKYLALSLPSTGLLFRVIDY